jgi:hypothetical protein
MTRAQRFTQVLMAALLAALLAIVLARTVHADEYEGCDPDDPSYSSLFRDLPAWAVRVPPALHLLVGLLWLRIADGGPAGLRGCRNRTHRRRDAHEDLAPVR